MTASLRGQRVCAVLFDLDGTLIDSAPDLALAGNVLREARGLMPIDSTVYRPYAGSGARGVLRVALSATPEQQEYEKLREEFFAAYQRHLLSQTKCFPEVEELLNGLVELDISWGIVTNKASRFTCPTIAAFNVLQQAKTVICGDTTPHIKPHPAPLLAAMVEARFVPEHTVYVGDDVRDIQAGRAAGVRTVAAAYGYLGSEADPQRWGADAVVYSPLELLKLFDTA